MEIVDLGRIPEAQRGAVTAALAVRYRPDDGHAGSMTLAEMLAAGRFSSTAVRTVNGRRQHGLLMDWPGLDEPQFLSVSRDLWLCVDLPEAG